MPAELWLHILALATAVPYDPSALDADPAQYPVEVLVPLYTHAQRTRLALATASRHFCTLALPALYAHIWLHRRAQARRLGQTLGAHPARGAWVRRLDIDCLASKTGAMQASALDIKPVIVAAGAHLRTLLDRRGTYVNVGDSFAHWPAMAERLDGRNLRRVRMAHYAERTRFASVLAALPRENLQVLELDLTLLDFVHPDEPGALQGLAFPRAHALTLVLGAHAALETYLPAMATWSFPALRTLRVLGSYAPTPALRAFFVAHGENVRVLELGTLSTLLDVMYPPPVFEPGAEWALDESILPQLEVPSRPIPPPSLHPLK